MFIECYSFLHSVCIMIDNPLLQEPKLLSENAIIRIFHFQLRVVKQKQISKCMLVSQQKILSEDANMSSVSRFWYVN